MRRRRLPLLLAILFAAAAGCGYSGDGTSGIKGQCVVTVFGVAPDSSGEQVGSGGPSAYGGATIRAQARGGDETLAETTADADGRFQIPLKPGTYHVVVVAPQRVPAGPPSPTHLPGLPAEPIDVEVKPGAFADVTVDFYVLAPAPPG
jgi:hypothetical protein